MLYKRSSALFETAKQYISGGVNSPVRSFKSVGGTPIFFQKAQGAYLFDVDENQYIDYINAWGPNILGYNHPAIVHAIGGQLHKGIVFGAPTELETQLAALIVNNIGQIERLRFVNSGTEACMSAIRLARGYTKRSKIIKFLGCYHGHADAFLIKAGSGALALGQPDSLGVTQATAQDTLLANYNDLDSVSYLIDKHKDAIAAIIIEPVAGNMGCIPPNPGFLKALRDLCTQNKIILIFDEVMTGFRLSFGGAQATFGVSADLVTFGKIIGGGLPVGAFGGRKDIMDCLAPIGGVYQAGTLSGGPIAMVAGYAQLSLLKENPHYYDQIEAKAAFLHIGLLGILKELQLPYTINRVGSMLSLFFTEEPVTDFESVKRSKIDKFNAFFHQMLAQGIYLPPSAYESWFISSALIQGDIDKTLEAARLSLKVI